MTQCKGCDHFKALPTDPNNLAAPKMGRCAAMPPQIVVLPTPNGLAKVVEYPHIPETFAACGMYKERWNEPARLKTQLDRR